MSNSVQPHRRQPTGLLCLRFSRQEYWSGLPFPSPSSFLELSLTYNALPNFPRFPPLSIVPTGTSTTTCLTIQFYPYHFLQGWLFYLFILILSWCPWKSVRRGTHFLDNSQAFNHFKSLGAMRKVIHSIHFKSEASDFTQNIPLIFYGIFLYIL